tara:strand:- start:230 stop:424 length:195 start_codon:yes stop_codon:yes gene_type:complete
MGLLKAAIFFLLGNFYISLIDTHLNKVKDVPILGDMFGDSAIKFIETNRHTVLVILMSLTALIV